eukprot:scaffold161074_cov32-Tisochrysis_lutea.AAC.1
MTGSEVRRAQRPQRMWDSSNEGFRVLRLASSLRQVAVDGGESKVRGCVVDVSAGRTPRECACLAARLCTEGTLKPHIERSSSTRWEVDGRRRLSSCYVHCFGILDALSL